MTIQRYPASYFVASDACIDLLKRFEGCSLSSYICPAGKPTIGIGHQVLSKDSILKEVLNIDISNPFIKFSITQKQATQILREDLKKFQKGLHNTVSASVTQNEFDALISFAFNIGIGNFRSSTLIKLLNSTKYDASADQFSRWCKTGANISPGLLKRRMTETFVFRNSSVVDFPCSNNVQNFWPKLSEQAQQESRTIFSFYNHYSAIFGSDSMDNHINKQS